jgi:hypothetical protein
MFIFNMKYKAQFAKRKEEKTMFPLWVLRVNHETPT